MYCQHPESKSYKSYYDFYGFSFDCIQACGGGPYVNFKNVIKHVSNL